MSLLMPEINENPEGLHRRYTVIKNDGSPTDPRAIYFVLRLDEFGKDREHIAACRQAARTYANVAPLHLKKMAEELENLLDMMDGEFL